MRGAGYGGFLIAFEGPDGSGKTTQRKLLKQWLKSGGHKVKTTKWNSSEAISPVIQARKSARSLDAREYCLMHAADFHERLETVVVPALRSGRIVIADRYAFTGLARDIARGLNPVWVRSVYGRFPRPDIVFYFAIGAELSADRIMAERAPRYYEAGQDVTGIDDALDSYKVFTRQVIDEYEKLAEEFDFIRIDAESPIYGQHRLIRGFTETRLPLPDEQPSWPGLRTAEVTLGL